MTDELPGNPELRASDADRERIAEILRDALAEGRLDMEEFDERLDATYKARTYGELTPITRDLPAAGSAPAPPVSMVKSPGGAPAHGEDWRARIGGEASSSWAVAILSGFQRKGVWTMPRRFKCFTFMGGGEIDLREARFEDREVVISCYAFMGGVNVVVPPGVEVVARGIGIMGGFDHREEGSPAEPGAPRVVVTGLAVMGGVGIERKVTRAERHRLREERRRDRVERREERRSLQHGRREEMRNALEERRNFHHDRHEEFRDAWEERWDRRHRRGR